MPDIAPEVLPYALPLGCAVVPSVSPFGKFDLIRAAGRSSTSPRKMLRYAGSGHRPLIPVAVALRQPKLLHPPHAQVNAVLAEEGLSLENEGGDAPMPGGR